MSEKRIFTVTDVTEYIKQKLEGDEFLSSLTIKGEISNLTIHSSGHLYFSVKDSGAVMRAVMFRSSASRLKFVPENGMKIFITGRISLYPPSGQYQINATSMEPDGIGALYLAYEQLKEKLEKEGLFDTKDKKPLPKIPLHIGIITSPTGAAVQDMLNILGRRFPMADVTLFPALVQGEGAPASLIRGVKYFDKNGGADVILIGRGGGSIEDLWAFNNEELARTIYKCHIPVISAVGHETDFTICDFVSDVRAPTPSAAAELAVPETAELKRKINNIVGRMELLASNSLSQKRKRVNELSQRKVMTSPSYILDDRRMMLDAVSEKLGSRIKYIEQEKKALYRQYAAKLQALNPMAVISRGYSAVFNENGKLIKSVNDIELGDSFSFRTSDGDVSGKVTGKNVRKDKTPQ